MTTNRKSFQINKLIVSSSIIAIIMIALLFLGFSFPQNIHNAIAIQKSFVSFHNLSISDHDQILEEQALIFDTKPIFLPSEWNEINVNSNKKIDKPLFTDLPPQITFYNYPTLSTIIHPELSILSSIDIFDNKFTKSFNMINQTKPIISPLNVREAYITIKNLNNFKIVQTFEINNQNPLFKEELWSPLEFLIIIDESGPITPLLITQSSGIEEIDNFFRNPISTPLLKLDQLPTGYYAIKVSP